MAFSVAAVILAAGASTRMAGRGSKALLPVGGRPILDWSLALFQSVACVDRIVVVTAEGDREMVTSLCQGYPKVATPVMGGPTRHDSEYRGLTALADSIDEGKIDTLLVHDAARPFHDRRCVRAAETGIVSAPVGVEQWPRRKRLRGLRCPIGLRPTHS